MSGLKYSECYMLIEICLHRCSYFTFVTIEKLCKMLESCNSPGSRSCRVLYSCQVGKCYSAVCNKPQYNFKLFTFVPFGPGDKAMIAEGDSSKERSVFIVLFLFCLLLYLLLETGSGLISCTIELDKFQHFGRSEN